MPTKARSNVRLFEEGLMPLVILASINSGYDYAYDIRLNLMNQDIQLAEGTVYSALKRMQERGLINSPEPIDKNPRIRRHYTITGVGQQKLLDLQDEFDDIVKFLKITWKNRKDARVLSQQEEATLPSEALV